MERDFEDARSLPDGSVIDSDIAVIGAGVAGITLAREFVGRGERVCLLEGGGMTLDPGSQALYEGETGAMDYPLAGARLRYFGGSSNHWGGYCRPLDEIDFEARDWVPHSGWPITRADLDPFYPRAAEVVRIAPTYFYDHDYWRARTGEPTWHSATGRLETQFVHYSPPVRFGQWYGAELARAPNLRVLLNANVVNIDAEANAGAVRSLALRTLDGRAHTVRARRYVLAAGGLENARLLLLSRDVERAGLGNRHDLVGRFFMEHPHLPSMMELAMVDIARLPRIYREIRAFDHRRVSAALKPSQPYLRSSRLLGATLQLGIAGRYGGTDASPHEKPTRAATHADLLLAARSMLTADTAEFARRDPGRIGTWLGVGSSGEMAPNPDSRVTLADSRDAFGLPRMRLDWRLTSQDRESLMSHTRTLAEEFGALGLGRGTFNVRQESDWPNPVSGGCHHMGTTRMSDDPRRGVVDRDCRVHGIANLYVAGSSVFVTCGTANPTLTLTALTLRLADHLKERAA